MQAIDNGIDTGVTVEDPKHVVIDAVKSALSDLNGYSITDTIDDVEVAELVGRVRALVGVLVTVVDR